MYNEKNKPIRKTLDHNFESTQFILLLEWLIDGE